jgi:hypothetical protein
MGDEPPVARRGLRAYRPALLLGLGWALALLFFNETVSRGWRHVYDAIFDGIYRVFSGFPGAQEMVSRAFHVLVWAFTTGCGFTLAAATLAVPLAFVARMVARARVRAGHADPLDRMRAWFSASRGRATAVAALFPVMTQALFLWSIHGFNRWAQWSLVYYAAATLLCGLAQMAVARAGLRALLAPTMPRGRAAPAPLDDDEIRFDAVAVTRETRLAVAAMATLSLGVAVWLATVPDLALFVDSRVLEVIAAYAAVGVGGAILFRRASKISVGVDGIYVGGTSRARFYAYCDLDEARARGGDIELVRRGRVVLRLQPHGEDAARRDAILARIHVALARVKDVERDAAANLVTSRSTEHVADSIRGATDYRMPSVTRDALWALVEGRAVDAATRTAAAHALARVEGETRRDRLRVAATHCADPRVRVALEELASHEDAAEHEDASEDASEEEEADASPARTTGRPALLR